jgi:conjugative relaxase-like TrwC/TraI family protein
VLSVGRIYADGGQEGAGATTGGSQEAGGRRGVSRGWRYLWEQVAEGAEDYYSADVARGEAAGRWAGRAAEPELGLSGAVTEEQMERVFGRLMHPGEDQVLGQEPRSYRSLAERLAAAAQSHRRRWTAEWAQREIELVAAGAGAERIEDELAGHREAAGEAWAEAEASIRKGGERAAIAGFDLTCSPPKSVSVLWAAADRDGREAIWRAHREGVAAALGYVEREAAWSRVGYNGVRQVDTSGLVVAAFDHRMSRHGDVQIHTHNAVLNRVRCADGEWRTLDSRALHHVSAAAGAIYDRVREAALEREVGVRHEQRKPDRPREIAGVDDEICRLFSSRRVQIEGRLAEMVAAYTARHGVAPTPWTTAQMSQWATLQTRTAKERTETTEEALARWEAESRARLGRSLAGVWDQAMAAGAEAADRAVLSDEEALALAVAAVDADKATWTRHDLVRELTKTVHVDRDVDAAGLLARVDRLVDAALAAKDEPSGVAKLSAPAVFDTPRSLRRHSDQASMYDRHGTERYSTDEGLARERRVLAEAGRGDGPKLDVALVEACLAAESPKLSDDQAQAARQVLTSGRPLEALVGPAGAGKTHTMGAVARAWRDAGGQVLGLAVAETAARTLADEADMATVNTAKLLFEHRERSAADKARPAWRQQWAINAGALVVLDEAAMASRQVIDDVALLCATAGAKLLLVGDHEQLAAPGAGGTFALVVDQVGAATLSEVRRFDADWERRASLRLRAGDIGVLADYDLRARIAGGDEAEMEDAAFEAALADRARGLRTFLLADTNEQAARLAGRLREQLVAAGAVDDARTVELHDGNRAGVGDRIVTRRNDRTNRAGGRFVANRDVWQVTEIHHDGALSAARVDPDSDQVLGAQQLRLDADYVAGHVQLEYAGTVHAAQGGTRAASHAIISERTSRQALYVALSRGVEDNRAYVICNRPEGADLDGPRQDPLGVLAAILEADDQPEELAAVAFQERSADQARSLATLFPVWQDLVGAVGRHRWQAAVAAACGEVAAANMVASDAWPTLAARLRVIDAAGADSAASLASAAGARTLAGAEDVAAVLHWRLRHVEAAAAPILAGTFAELSPAGVDELAVMIAQVAAAMDARSDELGARVQANKPAWAAELGPPPQPDDLAGGVDWRRRAGIVAGYREAFGLDDIDDPDPIGPMPSTNRADAAGWWRRAAVALDRAEPAGLAALPDERLEALVDQARQAEAAAPPSVGDQLRTISAQLRAARTAHGQAVLAGGPHSSAALEAARTVEALANAAGRLESEHRRREQWRQAASRLQAQAAAAATELVARADARTAAPFRDMDLSSLEAEIAQVEQRLAAAASVAQRHETLARRWHDRADQLGARLARATTERPQLAKAEATVAAERALADRIEQLQSALGEDRRIRRPRGAERQELIAEMSRLSTANPALMADPARREERWAGIIERAGQAERRWLGDLQAQLHAAAAQSEEHAAIAAPTRADIDERADRAGALRDELERRAHPTAVPTEPCSPAAQPDQGAADTRRVVQPAAGPDAAAVVPAVACETVDPQRPGLSATAAARPGRELGHPQAPGPAVNAAKAWQEEESRQQPSLVVAGLDLETLRSALAAAEQRLRTATIVVERYETVRQRWQETADSVGRELTHVTENRPYVSIAEANVAEQREVAARIDELQSALGRSRLALRGAAREDLAEELNGLINANPTLRFNLVLREDRWTTIIERAYAAEQQRIAEIRAQLQEAVVHVADNAGIVADAAATVEEQGQLCSTLRGELDTRTAGAVTAADTVTTPPATEPQSVSDAEPSEAICQAMIDPPVDATWAPLAAIQHHQMQLPVEASRTMTEGLGG